MTFGTLTFAALILKELNVLAGIWMRYGMHCTQAAPALQKTGTALFPCVELKNSGGLETVIFTIILDK